MLQCLKADDGFVNLLAVYAFPSTRRFFKPSNISLSELTVFLVHGSILAPTVSLVRNTLSPAGVSHIPDFPFSES